MNAKLIFAAIAVLFCTGAFAEDIVDDNDWRAGETGYVTGEKANNSSGTVVNESSSSSYGPTYTTTYPATTYVETPSSETPVNVNYESTDSRSNQGDVNAPLEQGTMPFVK